MKKYSYPKITWYQTKASKRTKYKTIYQFFSFDKEHFIGAFVQKFNHVKNTVNLRFVPVVIGIKTCQEKLKIHMYYNGSTSSIRGRLLHCQIVEQLATSM